MRTPEPSLPAETSDTDWVGVDLDITNIAYTSDGADWSGGAVTHTRKRNPTAAPSISSPDDDPDQQNAIDAEPSRSTTP